MKHLLSLLATSAVFAICSLLQTGCAEGYAVAAPGYGPYAPYGGAYYGGVGFYRGAYYGNSVHFFEQGRWELPIKMGVEAQSLAPENQLFILMQAGL